MRQQSFLRSQNQNNVIARIKSDNPEENKVLVESNNEAELSQGVINRLRLQMSMMTGNCLLMMRRIF